MTLILGAVAATLLLLAVAAILIGTAEGRPILHRTRLAAWCAFWLAVAAALTLAEGMHRGGRNGWRKLAARFRAIRPGAKPEPAPERPLPPKPYQGRHGKPRTMGVSTR